MLESTVSPAGEPRQASPGAPAIACRSLRKVYDGDVVAVDRLDLHVRRGECFGLLGPNGAGKTTTIEILEGLLRPTEGEVEVLGHRWGDDDRALRQRIGVSLQETRLSEKLTVLETVRLFRSFYRQGLEPGEIVDRVSLGAKSRSQVGKLSGGQRQRLALACALVGEPELLFLDEPTNGLDPQARRQVWEILRDVLRRGCTVLITTHYMDEAEKLCDRVGIVDHGRIIALDSPAGLIHGLGGDHILEFTVSSDPPRDSRPSEEAEDTPARELAPDVAARLQAALQELPAVRAVRPRPGGFTLSVGEPHVAVPAVLARIDALDLSLLGLSTRHASLEDVFVNLTGRHLRDDGDET